MTAKEQKLKKDAIDLIERLDDEYGDDERLDETCQYILKILKQPSIDDMLDKISAEIEERAEELNDSTLGECIKLGLREALEVVEKYKEEGAE